MTATTVCTPAISRERPPVVGSVSGRRIAIVSDAIYPFNKGGKELRYHEISRRLAARGAIVDVYTMQWWPKSQDSSGQDLSGQYSRGRDTGGQQYFADGVEFHAICPLLALYSGDRRSIRQALMFSMACLRLLRCDFDVIEADHMPYLPLFVLRLVATMKRVPLVVTWHEVWGKAYWREYLGSLGVVGAWVERTAMRLPDVIVADVEETRHRLRLCGVAERRIRVVPIGIDCDAIDRVRSEGQRFDVVFVGRLLEHKGVAALIDALEYVSRSVGSLSCAVIGEGPELRNLREQVDALGLTEGVLFLGRLEADEDVWRVMKSARVLALPSVREGFGIVVLEAIANGIPVVTSNHIDNLAQHLVAEMAAGLACGNDPADLGAALLTMLRAPADLTLARSVLANRYSWDAIIDQLSDVYCQTRVGVAA